MRKAKSAKGLAATVHRSPHLYGLLQSSPKSHSRNNNWCPVATPVDQRAVPQHTQQSALRAPHFRREVAVNKSAEYLSLRNLYVHPLRFHISVITGLIERHHEADIVQQQFIQIALPAARCRHFLESKEHKSEAHRIGQDVASKGVNYVLAESQSIHHPGQLFCNGHTINKAHDTPRDCSRHKLALDFPLCVRFRNTKLDNLVCLVPVPVDISSHVHAGKVVFGTVVCLV